MKRLSLLLIIALAISVAPQAGFAQLLGEQKTVDIPKVGGILGWHVDQVGGQVNLTIDGAILSGTYQVQPTVGVATCGDITPKVPAPSVIGLGAPFAQLWAGTCSLMFCNATTNKRGANFDAFVWYYDPVLGKQGLIQILEHSRSFWTDIPC
jgi:hypothetical protein